MSEDLQPPTSRSSCAASSRVAARGHVPLTRLSSGIEDRHLFLVGERSRSRLQGGWLAGFHGDLQCVIRVDMNYMCSSTVPDLSKL